MGIFYVGIDLAKNVFAVHGVNQAGKPDLVAGVPRARLHELIASLWRSTKDGDAYLRKMLILGARAVLAAKNKTDAISRWATALEERRGCWKAVVAIAAKDARMARAMLAKGESFELPA